MVGGAFCYIDASAGCVLYAIDSQSMETVTSLYARWKLRHCARVGREPRVRGHVWIHGRGEVLLGDGVVLDAGDSPIELHALEPGSRLVLGDGLYIGCRTSLAAVVSGTHRARIR